jgi:hypothetical protein
VSVILAPWPPVYVEPLAVRVSVPRGPSVSARVCPRCSEWKTAGAYSSNWGRCRMCQGSKSLECYHARMAKPGELVRARYRKRAYRARKSGAWLTVEEQYSVFGSRAWARREEGA